MRTTNYEYDANGNLTGVQDPDGLWTTMTYDAAGTGLLLSVRDKRGNFTTYTYDGHRRLATDTAPGGAVTTYTYDAFGNRATVVDALGRTSGTVFDGRNHLLKSTAADGGVTDVTYTPSGAVATVTAPADYDGRRELTVTSYDARGLATKVVRGSGGPWEGVTTYAYDAAGNRTGITTGLGGPSAPAGYANRYDAMYVYDELGRRTDVYESGDRAVGPDGVPLVRRTRTTYDLAGNVASTTDARGVLTRYIYDPMDRLTGVYEDVPADPGSYDAARITLYGYDAAGQLVMRGSGLSTRYAEVAPHPVVTSFGYDIMGRVAERHDGVGSIFESVEKTTYDENGNVVRSESGLAGPNAPAGYALPGVTTFAYDGRNRVTDVTAAAGTAAATRTTYQYDAVGNLLTVTAGLAGSGAPAGYAHPSTTTYSYDPVGRVLVVTAAAGSGNERTTGYTYDRAGNLLTETDARGVVTSYQYDGLGRATAVTEAVGLADLQRTTTYAYDAADNLVGETTPIGYDLVTSTGPAGNNPVVVPVTNPGRVTTTYAYDGLGRLVRAAEAGGTAVERSTTYAYDAADNLVGVTAGLRGGRRSTPSSFAPPPTPITASAR